jgi:hypothetical protein
MILSSYTQHSDNYCESNGRANLAMPVQTDPTAGLAEYFS